MHATDPTTSEPPTPAQQQPSPSPASKISRQQTNTNSTPVGYGQLDSDDQEMVLRCPVCHCLITNQTNFCKVLSFLS